uniref:Uncharacterized protein n=1 Tax=Tanacetum cinerariifolium TaxID=118510 RepID=A0A6L2K3V1_TANCI|nr:hypothetical protein [Tanacetum cinerariifolium]
MNPIATQQAILDNALVPPEKRLKIERCNAIIAFSKQQREQTYQVTLEALKLSPCYPAFLITTEVPEIYMHKFWNTVTKIRDTDAYSFKLDKKKCRVDTEVFHEILQICSILSNQEFVTLPLEEELLSFIKELGYSEPVKKAKQVQRPAKKSTPTSTAGVIVKDTHGKRISPKSKKDSHMLHASGSSDGVGSQPNVPDESEDKTTGTNKGTGTKPGVPNVPSYESDSDNELWGDSFI